MITAEYCLTFARYNAWQNKQLKAAFHALGEAELRRDRNGFFGSILETANHILWGDQLWLSRIAGMPPPSVGMADSARMTETLSDWDIARFQTDGALLEWAKGLRSIDLAGPLEWTSGSTGEVRAMPKAQCAAHMFNHQTHHRGQIHAMLTAAGRDAPVTDMIFMPSEGPWL
ncbi:DinB family protein [Tropicibacter naphthalenivorans]|uniref:DinB family protein n=1 Tax=Tropicibacter naphthalenivorans TaxID=441103 RepID=A0A0P1GN93_9RHOB|nr:DinB family protein [Tropicibacter naphthalenivorans]CUH76806.1 DinB family protein [Tropicibacter naphthalenivorans]SMC62850.1 Uncharacterized damage-inducible protein DinB (forms a four-helix bundle) [Tropicibacter naphthalenivorans]